jgi:hypothetical protein
MAHIKSPHPLRPCRAERSRDEREAILPAESKHPYRRINSILAHVNSIKKAPEESGAEGFSRDAVKREGRHELETRN